MKKVFNKKNVAAMTLLLFGLSFMPIVPFGPKLPPVELLQESSTVTHLS